MCFRTVILKKQIEKKLTTSKTSNVKTDVT